ncbi:hypothetical protein SAMN05216227_10118 [Pseudorhodobacter antarcticus]|uniref:Uncharacterized protein n=1 Tax=Pseudorhodobacter antarcticus TaxID=1077947 RepID=A0A1H8FHH8_9RHOB|nr:hypothetical protein [Pseudorhodobacter antarcticus]SEN31082.1 hypothetical protein SAMN05216227_10118 [Pseudorhodobacter antarcticus]
MLRGGFDVMKALPFCAAVLGFALGGVAAPQAAQAGSFVPPQGCTAFLTVQSRACRVSTYYTCTQDTPGDQWRADFDQEGMFFLSRVDREGQWVESIELNPTVRQTLDAAPEDQASFTDLLGGIDTFAFNLSRDNGENSRVRGFDRLTGQSVVIDGVTLSQTEFEYGETDTAGTPLRRARGTEYIHPEWRLFFAGPTEWDGGEGYVPMDGSPVEFMFPGEPGFAAMQPVFECDAILSNYSKGAAGGF